MVKAIIPAMGDNLHIVAFAIRGSGSPNDHVAVAAMLRVMRNEQTFKSLVVETMKLLEDVSLYTTKIQVIFKDTPELQDVLHSLGMWCAMPSVNMYHILEKMLGVKEPTQNHVSMVAVIYDMALTRLMTLLRNTPLQVL